MHGDTTGSCHQVLFVGPAPLPFLSVSPGSACAHGSAQATAPAPWSEGSPGMPNAPSATALPRVPRRDRRGSALLSPCWAVCFGASLTDCFGTAASLCPGFPGFLLFFLPCILCRDVGMKTAFVLPKPPYGALLLSPAGADAVLCLHRAGAAGFGGWYCRGFGGWPGTRRFAFLIAAFQWRFPRGNPVPALCGKLGNHICSCRTAQHTSLGSLVGDL